MMDSQVLFKNPKGNIILPDIIRKFKLNFLGKRSMKGENYEIKE